MRNIKPAFIMGIVFLLLLNACGPKATPTLAPAAVTDIPVVTGLPLVATTNAIEIISIDPPVANGLSANDPITITVNYSLVEIQGQVQVWFERFQDADCTILGYDTGPKPGSTIPGGTMEYIEWGIKDYVISLPPIPPFDTAYIGVGVRLWMLDGYTSLAEDMRYEWCYPARAATAVLLPPGPTLDVATIPGLISTNTPLPPGAPPAEQWTGRLSGFVILDEDLDGAIDDGDPGIPGCRMDLADSTCLTSLQSMETIDGGFSFSGLVPGTYCVILNCSLGRVVTPGLAVWVDVAEGISEGSSFSVFFIQPAAAPPPPPPPPPPPMQTGSILGRVTLGGAPAPGFTVQLTGRGIRPFDWMTTPIYNTTTDSQGYFNFQGLSSGYGAPGEISYSITATDPVSGATGSVSGVLVMPGEEAFIGFDIVP